jgi:NADPH:quinone reductase-like Zn-dependent oxidoreductase
LTAWELLVEGFGIPIPVDVGDENVNRNKSLLVLGGAGGVGSLAIQIAKHVRLLSYTSLCKAGVPC